jgi:ABC-type glycerol-3-phosphate transport system substrate-binding protein
MRLRRLALGVAFAAIALPAAAEPLSFWFQSSTPDHERILRAQIGECAAKQPGLEVRAESVGLDVMYPRLATALKDRKPPNIVNTVESVVAFLQARKSLAAVDDVIDAHGRGDFIPSFLHAVSGGGKAWAVPDWALHHAVWYRKDLFREAGIAAPPRTWAELGQAAEKLTRDRNGDGVPDQFGFGLPWGAKFFAAQQSLFDAFYAQGITVVDPKTGAYAFGGRKAEAAASLEVMMALFRKASPPASIDWSLVEIRAALMNGQIAAGMEWGGIVKLVEQQKPELLDQLGVFPFPGEGGPAAASLGGGFIFMVGAAPDPEVAASKALVGCLMQAETVARRANSRAIFALPAIDSAYATAEFRDNPINRRFAEEITVIREQVIARWHRYGLEAGLNPVSSVMESTSFINETMQKVALGKMTSIQAVDALDDFMKKAVARP